MIGCVLDVELDFHASFKLNTSRHVLKVMNVDFTQESNQKSESFLSQMLMN